MLIQAQDSGVSVSSVVLGFEVSAVCGSGTGGRSGVGSFMVCLVYGRLHTVLRQTPLYAFLNSTIQSRHSNDPNDC